VGKLKELGMRILIDDFGTGYFRLNYLKRFPLDTLKIDRTFVSDIAEEDEAAIVKAIISLAHILNLQVQAEGIGTEQQNRFLMEGNCNEVQGYYFGAPMPAVEFVGTLSEQLLVVPRTK
jgi:EAL domain-containing protein (putative c-di-GMP-specific phosphodiesterase class I)